MVSPRSWMTRSVINCKEGHVNRSQADVHCHEPVSGEKRFRGRIRKSVAKCGWDGIRISILFRASWSFICSRDRRRKTIPSIPRIPFGRASGPSRRGPNRKNSGRRTRVPVTRRLDRFIWSIRGLKASKYVKPSLERRRPRERPHNCVQDD